MLHGFTGNKTETHFLYTRLARQLATQGIAALRFDFAGSGDSQGEFAGTKRSSDHDPVLTRFTLRLKS